MVAPFRRVNNPADAVQAVQELLYDGPLGVSNPALANAAGQTLTVAQMLGGTLQRSGAVTVSDTTATAAAIIAAMGNPADGTSRLWIVRNANTGTLTLLAGTSVTLAGTTTIPTVNTRVYLIQKTGATTVSITGLMVAPN